MKKLRLLLNLIFLIIWSKSFSQNFIITAPSAEYDGYKVVITYNLINENPNDLFFTRVEITKKNGTPVLAKSLKGDVGDKIKPGNNKTVIWIPTDDAIFLDDTVFVEILGEKYERSFNKGSMLLISTALPGLGQTKISKGKPWWLTGVVAYGTLAGGFVFYNNYLKTYDSYKKELNDIARRSELIDKATKEKNISTALFITAASVWAGNIIWVAVTPNRTKPLKLKRLSLYAVPGNQNMITMLSLKITF